MSIETALTLQDLELETAELLPSRETLCGCYCERGLLIRVDVDVDIFL